MTETTPPGAAIDAQEDLWWSFEAAHVFADEVIAHFSSEHPGVVMSLHQWHDLREIIERALRGLPWHPANETAAAVDRAFAQHQALPSSDPLPSIVWLADPFWHAALIAELRRLVAGLEAGNIVVTDGDLTVDDRAARGGHAGRGMALRLTLFDRSKETKAGNDPGTA